MNSRSRIRPALAEFVKQESSAGIVLMGVAVLALLLVNLGGGWLYSSFLQTKMIVGVGDIVIDKPLLLWINDGLMAVFFFLVGLEVKREVLDGQLSSWSQASLPVFAAIGGMAVPAAVFVAINQGVPANLQGWAIPAATDIAFALGVLALLGTRAPTALKVLLLAIAIIDDIGAILIIAVFYTTNLSLAALAGAAVAAIALFVANRAGIVRPAFYVLIGVVMWVFVLKSGVHATLAGVLTALAIPLRTKAGGEGPLRELEHSLHPYVAFLVLPVFAFANAGVLLAGVGPDEIFAPLPLGIMAGLFIGKQVGVFGACVIAVKSGLAKMPEGVSWMQLYGLSALTGIGFTMSLFIGNLAFADPATIDAVKVGVLGGSALAGVLGFVLLRLACPDADCEDEADYSEGMART
ncbi:MAG: Na+/H+ antiporter NhaA [Sphingomonadaceae bacterium]